MWITKDSQIALFKVNILPERRWSVNGKNVQLITEAELVEPSLIFAIVYHLPKKLEHKTFDENTPPILHVYGKHIKLGFQSHYNLLQHDYSLQHDNLDINIPTSTTKIFIPVCGVSQQLQFCFTNITNKPSFNKVSARNSNEDFGTIEIYGYSLRQIPAPRVAIPMLNLSTFFQYQSHKFLKKNKDADSAQNDCQLLMTAAECDTLCGYISIQARYFNQAKELFERAKKGWTKLNRIALEDEDSDNERNSFRRQMREKADRFKYNALILETLIAYSMNEHNDFKTQIQSIVNIINHHKPIISDESSDNLLPLQIISKYSRSLIKTLLLTSNDSNEFVQVASFKNIYFIIEKLGCNIKQDLCPILSEIFEFNASKNVSEKTNKRIKSKPLHIQSIMRQIISIKHNICDSALNLISDCNYEIVQEIFETLIITNFPQIMKLESAKLAYCLRIFELCIERLHSTPNITADILTSIVGLMYYQKKKQVQNIATSICRSLLFILPTQILQINDEKLQIEICKWLCDMITNTDMNQEVVFETNNDKHPPAKRLLIEVPVIIIKKMCEIQISWNENKKVGLLNIKSHVNELCVCLKERILKLLINGSDVQNSFTQFRLLLQSLDFVSCAICDYEGFDHLIMSVLRRFLEHLKTSSPSSMMLSVCVEFIQYINIENGGYASQQFIDITLQILQQFHSWIPHSIHDETFVLAQKLIDINYMFLSHDDFCLIIESLLSKYTLRSADYQEFQYALISKIYQRIQNKPQENDTKLFKLVTKLLIFDAADFKDQDKMIRYFEFAYDWLQNECFQSIYIEDFHLIFMRIVTIFNRILFQCKQPQIINISSDIVTSIASHFSCSMKEYLPSKSKKAKIINILNKICVFYTNALEIDIGSIQFHCVENITLFLRAAVKLSAKGDSFLNKCIQTLITQLFELSFDSHFTTITDLCLWSISNLYYDILRDKNPKKITLDDTELIVKYTTQMMQNPDYKIRRWCGIILFMRFCFNDFSERSVYESAHAQNGTTYKKKHEAIYQQLLLDFDESVTEPLINLSECQTTKQMRKYIDNSDLLARPSALVTSNLNNEVLIEGRSDTASVNQARTKFPGLLNSIERDEFKIVDVDYMNSDIEDISDEDDENDEPINDMLIMEENKDNKENQENNTILSNLSTRNQSNHEIEDDVLSISSDDNMTPPSSPSSASSDIDVISSDDNMSIVEQPNKSKCLRNKIEIPLLPLKDIMSNQIQTNIVSVCVRGNKNDIVTEEEEEEEQAEDEVEQHEICTDDDQRGRDADDERDESTESQPINHGDDEQSTESLQSDEQDVDDADHSDVNINMEAWIEPENAPNINFERGTSRYDDVDDDDDDDDEVVDNNNNKKKNKWRNIDLDYIDSFLQSISVSNEALAERNDAILNTNDVSVNILDDECNEEHSLDEERFEEFKRSKLDDFLVNVPQLNNRENGWWMKYLNSAAADARCDDSKN